MEERPSKSQKKRDAAVLKKLGVQLVTLPLEKLKRLPLDEQLFSAIVDAKNIASHGASRRQAQLIGKLLRHADYEAIEQTLMSLQQDEKAQTKTFHDAEQWREKLLTGDNEALTQFIAKHPNTDPQQLRHLIRKTQKEREKNQNLGAYTQLFRFIKECLS